MVIKSLRLVKSPRNSLMTPGLEKHQPIFMFSISHERHLPKTQQPNGYTKQCWTPSQPVAGTRRLQPITYLSLTREFMFSPQCFYWIKQITQHSPQSLKYPLSPNKEAALFVLNFTLFFSCTDI